MKDLGEKLENLKGYKVNAKMTLQMGTEPQSYDVEIWHMEPMYYRVDLKNSEKDQSQMILRNDEGVFVLTPALNKSFRFQSDWPKNSSQAYLYESLIQDILEDKEAKFTVTDGYYIFETKTRYQNNKMLPLQEVTLNKKDLSPVSVKVMDTDRKALVMVEFSNMDFKATFEKKDFEMNNNMTRAQLEIPVMGSGEIEPFTVKYPSLDLMNVSLVEEKSVETDSGKRVILTFAGEKSFTLIQEQATVIPTAMVPIGVSGEPVDLGFTIGALTNNTLTWTYKGVDYTLASHDLTVEEMIEVALSLDGEEVGK